MEKLTIEDVAQLCGVSRATISRVINNDPKVSKKTRELVLQTIQRVSYQPNPFARGLAKGKQKLIALILGNVRNPFFSHITDNIQSIMQDYGYPVILFHSKFNPELERLHLRQAIDLNLCGIFLVSTLNGSELTDILRDYSEPVVLLHRQIPDFNRDCVTQDNFRAGYILTNHLIGLGHQRIAFLYGPTTSTSSNSRVAGYRAAMANAMLSVDERYLFPGDFRMETGYQFGKDYFRLGDSAPKAVICGNDLMAIGFLEACKDNQVNVPNDLSVASFDDIELAALKSIQLTTIQQDVETMCIRACEIMRQRIDGEQLPPRCIILPPVLTVRNTTATPKS